MRATEYIVRFRSLDGEFSTYMTDDIKYLSGAEVPKEAANRFLDPNEARAIGERAASIAAAVLCVPFVVEVVEA